MYNSLFYRYRIHKGMLILIYAVDYMTIQDYGLLLIKE